MKTTDRINELFLLCGGPNGFVEMRSALKLLWPTLNNAVSLVDLAGVFAVSIPSSLNTEVLNGDLFSDFFRSFARLKFSAGSDFVEKLLEELGPVKRLMSDHAVLNSVADKNTVRILLKFDLPLRRAFSLFCSKSLRGGRVTWEEVRQLSLGVEVCMFEVEEVVVIFTPCNFKIYILINSAGWIFIFLWRLLHCSHTVLYPGLSF